MQSTAIELPAPVGTMPIRIDETGTARIGNSRITLDLLVGHYENGMSAEDLVRAYDTLDLADVYSAIAYYLRHRAEVRAYRSRRAAEADVLREEIEASRPRIPLEILHARRAASQATHGGLRVNPAIIVGPDGAM